MQENEPHRRLSRRGLLRSVAASSAAMAISLPDTSAANTASAKPLTGIFPIAQSPFTASNRLDLEALVEELRFIHRGGVHGFVWPQLASEWDTLSETERLEGAEAIAGTGRSLRPAIVLGVQAREAAQAVKYARHAAKAGADAIISLPLPGQSDPDVLLAYYKEIGRAADLPLFVQAIGTMSVEHIVRMHREVPTLRYVKDEAGQPLMRIQKFREQSRGELKIFTGGHGRTLIDEMMRGFTGSMPAASFADLYATAWDQWHRGHQREAIRTFGNAAILIEEVMTYADGIKYILEIRGVFKTHRLRTPPGAGEDKRLLLDEKGKAVLRTLLDTMKPSLRT